ncbi:MAG: amidophosphoribosyltransferase [bacterium]
MCGILGIYSHGSVATEIYDGLIHLQHRGQDATGICTYDTKYHVKKGSGYVRDVFHKGHISRLTGNWGIGHTRYSTVGSRFDVEDAQPFKLHSPYGIAMAHNGDLTNYKELKEELMLKDKRHCNSGCDVEIILNVFASSMQESNGCNDIFDQICVSVNSVFNRCKGGYSVVGILADKGMFAFRDPHGIRPCVWGSRKNRNNTIDYIFSSENTMYYPLGFEFGGDVLPGEVVFIDNQGQMTKKRIRKDFFTPCIFEYVYLARPDSMINQVSVYRSRLRMGQNLARRWKEVHPDLLPDIVIPVPFSSNTSALAMAHELGIRYSEGLYKNPFVGRTFIMQGQENRKKSILQKLSPQVIEIKNKNVMLVDDSIVRGNTSKKVIDLVKYAGAKKIYFVSACPPVKYPDFYGIDIPTRNELIAHNKSQDEIRDYIGADVLFYQRIEDLVEAVTRRGEHNIDRPSMPYLDGWYVTGDIDEEKIKQLEEEKSVL